MKFTWALSCDAAGFLRVGIFVGSSLGRVEIAMAGIPRIFVHDPSKEHIFENMFPVELYTSGKRVTPSFSKLPWVWPASREPACSPYTAVLRAWGGTAASLALSCSSLLAISLCFLFFPAPWEAGDPPGGAGK